VSTNPKIIEILGSNRYPFMPNWISDGVMIKNLMAEDMEGISVTSGKEDVLLGVSLLSCVMDSTSQLWSVIIAMMPLSPNFSKAL